MKPILDIKNTALEFVPFFEMGPCEDDEGYWGLPLGFQPRFEYCAKNLDEHLFIAEIARFINSLIMPGDHEIITCTCGYADHAGIDVSVLVAHPDKDTIVWELDAENYYFLFDNIQKQDGFLRITFMRDVYEIAVRAALHKAMEMQKLPLTPEEFCNYQLKDNLSLKSEDLQKFPLFVDEMMPNNTDVDEFCIKELQRDWKPSPLFEPNTQIEIGVFGDNYARSSSNRVSGYIQDYFTRWKVWKAYTHWWETLQWFSSGDNDTDSQIIHIPDGTIILRKGCRAEDSHERGRIFSEIFAATLAQDSFCDKNISVQYIAMPLIERL